MGEDQLMAEDPNLFESCPITSCSSCQCGEILFDLSEASNSFSSNLGIFLERNSLPWQVAIYNREKKDEFLGAGVLISDRHVLTTVPNSVMGKTTKVYISK